MGLSKANSAGDFIKPDPGVYTATVTEVSDIFKQSYQGGPEKDRIYIVYTIVDDEDFDGAELRAYYGYTFHPQGKLIGTVEAIIGRELDDDEEFSHEEFIDLLLDKRCQITLADGNPKADGRVYSEVVAVAPIRKKKAVKAVPKDDEADADWDAA